MVEHLAAFVCDLWIALRAYCYSFHVRFGSSCALRTASRGCLQERHQRPILLEIAQHMTSVDSKMTLIDIKSLSRRARASLLHHWRFNTCECAGELARQPSGGDTQQPACFRTRGTRICCATSSGRGLHGHRPARPTMCAPDRQAPQLSTRADAQGRLNIRALHNFRLHLHLKTRTSKRAGMVMSMVMMVGNCQVRQQAIRHAAVPWLRLWPFASPPSCARAQLQAHQSAPARWIAIAHVHLP